MLMKRGIETRLRKVEAALRPPKAVFFLAWGGSEAGIERAVSSAKVGGIVGRGDRLVQAI